MEVILPIGIGVGVYVVLAYFRGWFPFKAAKQPTRTTAPGIILPDSFPYQYTRPDGGIIVTTTEIPEPVREEFLRRVVSGLQRSSDAAVAVFPEWNRGIGSASASAVIFIDQMATTEAGYPALLVSRTKTAGTVINVGDSSGNEIGEPYIVAPSPTAEQISLPGYLDYLEATCYNENEHRQEWLNNKGLFWTYTGPEDVHPHRAPGSFGLVNKLYAICTWNRK